MSDEQTPDDSTQDEPTPDREEVVAEPAEAPGGPERPAEETRQEVAGRSPVGIIVTLVVLVAIAAIALWYFMGGARPEARELLQQTVANYQQADQIHVESTMAYEMSMGEQQNDMEMPTSAWFSRPNKMYFQAGNEMQQTTAVSDGEHMYLEVGMFPGAIKLPAPASLAEMPLDNLSMSGGAGVDTLKLPDIASLLSGGFDVANLATVQHGIPAENEWLASLESPEGTWPLMIKPETGPAVAMWIDKADKVVRKYAAMIDFDAMVESNPEIQQQLEQLPEERRQAVEEMVTRFEATVSTVELGQQPPENTFTYEPGEGIEVVEAQTIEEGIQKLMTQMMEQQGMPGGPPPGAAPPAPEGEAGADEAPAPEEPPADGE
jgi:outer membrane lipoprotein-sorting protein